MENPKLCECGCGKPSPIAKKTQKKYGHIKGQSLRFIFGHQQLGKHPSKETRKKMSETHIRNYQKLPYHRANWKGGRTKTVKGYILIKLKDHPKSNINGYVLEHLLIWEKIHNKRLPEGYIIHHLNGIKWDNRPENLLAMKKHEHVTQTEPYKKRIRELELEITRLKQLNLFKGELK